MGIEALPNDYADALNHHMISEGNKIELQFRRPQDGMPPKPGKMSYEQIPCLCVQNGEWRVLFWNCEDEVWDDEDGDDYAYERDSVELYAVLPEELPTHE